MIIYFVEENVVTRHVGDQVDQWQSLEVTFAATTPAPLAIRGDKGSLALRLPLLESRSGPLVIPKNACEHA